MTDNEKAATFIGWKAEPHHCDGWLYIGGDHPTPCPNTSHIRILPFIDMNTAQSVSRKESDHTAPCPDMSRPENYMRALAALHDLYPYVKWYDGSWHISQDWEDGWIDANSPMKLLAALYDTEHQGEPE